MNKHCSILVILFNFFLINHSSFSQQDQVFSQFYTSGIYLNPALGGMDARFSVAAMYRSQWTGLNPINSALINAIIPVNGGEDKAIHRGGIGINLYNSDYGEGLMVKTGAALNLSYNLFFKSSVSQKITFGVKAGVMQTQFNLSNVKFGSQYDPNAPDGYNATLAGEPDLNNSLTKIIPEISAGLLYYYNVGRDIYAPGISGYFGLAVSHLTSPNAAFSANATDKVPMFIKVHGGIEIHLAKRINFAPNALYGLQGENYLYMTGGIFTLLFPDHDNFIQPTKFLLGVSYRSPAVIVFHTGFGSKYYSIGFSYDYGLSPIKNLTGIPANAFELSLKTSINFGGKSKKSSKFHTPLM